jgi:hypothetical protein
MLVDGAMHEGASVFETRYIRNPENIPNRTREYRARAWGEAVVVDLGGKGLLFGLLGSVFGVGARNRFDPLGQRTLVNLLPPEDRDYEAFKSGHSYEAVARLQREHRLPLLFHPVLVRFNDVADLNTVMALTEQGQRVEPTPLTRVRSLHEAYGDGAALESATVEITNERPTNRIRQLLPWMKTMNGANGVTRGSSDRPLGQNLRYTNFRMDGVRND